MDNGTVLHYLSAHPECNLGNMVRNELLKLLYVTGLIDYIKVIGIARGLGYLHSKDIIHSDIKAVSVDFYKA